MLHGAVVIPRRRVVVASADGLERSVSLRPEDCSATGGESCSGRGNVSIM